MAGVALLIVEHWHTALYVKELHSPNRKLGRTLLRELDLRIGE